MLSESFYIIGLPPFDNMKNNIKHTFFFVLIIILHYPLVIVGDWLLEKSLTAQWFADTTPEHSEKVTPEFIHSLMMAERKLIEKYRTEGALFALTPLLFEQSPPLRALMFETEIGALGATPNTEVVMPCDEGYGAITYTTDRFGLRNNDTKWDSEIDTLFIGDSFTLGECVASDFIISKHYEVLADKKSINLGNSGNNPKHYAVLAELFIAKVKPQEVYLVFYPNDSGTFDSPIFDMHVIKNKPFFDDNGMLYPKKAYFELHKAALNFGYGQASASEPESLFGRVLRRASLPGIRRIINSATMGILGDSRTAIDIAIAKCQQVQCELKVVYIPASEYWGSNSSATEYAKALKNYTTYKNVTFLDASKLIETDRASKDYAIKGPHLSPQGYRKVATLLANGIR